MRQTVIKLVDVILKRIEDHPEAVESESGMRSWLAGEGYAKRDIDAAMHLVRPQLASGRAPQGYMPRSMRTLNLYEEYKLTPDARAALMRLEMFELIDADERELIFDRLNHFDGVVGMEELEYLVSWLICSTRDVESQQTVYSVLFGEGSTYH